MAATSRTVSSRTVLWTLSAAMGLTTIGQSMLATAVPLLAVALGLAPAWVGILVALPNVLPVALGMRAGGRIDRGGAGQWLAGGVAGMASAPLLLALAPQTGALAVAQVLLGASQMVAALASQAYVADATPRGGLERSYATYATFLSAGRLVGPVTVGVVIDAAGFRVAFAAAGASMVAAWFVVARLRRIASSPTPRAIAEDGESRDDDAHLDAPLAAHGDAATPDPDDPGSVPSAGRPFGVRDAWRNVGVQLAVLASSAVFVAISVRQAFLPVVLDDVGFRATEIGLLVSMGGVASVTLRPLMPVVSRLLGGPARTLAVSLGLLTVGVGALGLVSSFWAFTVLALAAGAATGFGNPLSIVTVAQHVASTDRGTALGLRMAANRAAQLIAPIGVGGLIGVAGFAVGFGAVGVVMAVAAVLVVARVPAYERAAAGQDTTRSDVVRSDT